MYTNSVLAVAGALLSVVAAVPMAGDHQHHHHHHHVARDYVWVAYTEVVYETIALTKTVWVEPGETTPESTPTPSSSTSSETTAAATTPAAYVPPPPPAYNPPAPPAYTSPAPPSYAPVSTSSSVYVASPAPTTPTTTYVAPAPTYVEPAPTYVAPAPSYEEPAPYVPPTSEAAPSALAESAAPEVPSTSSGQSGMAAPGTTYTGDLTWYDVGLGACGLTNTKDEAVVAIPEAIFDAYTQGNPNLNPLCGGTVTITGKDGQKHTAKIVDRCPGCTKNDLDLSQDFFNKVTNYGDGRVGGMEWCFD